MTVAKDQHFLPQFYLRGFTDPATPSGQEPYVWIFELPEHRWRRRAPKNIASLRHYYAYQDENNQLVNIIEPSFAAIESLGATLIRKLEARRELTEPEQVHFSLFVALLTVRTPQHRKNTERIFKHQGRDIVTTLIQHWRENPDDFEASRRNYQEKTETVFAMTIDDFEQHAPELMLNDAGVIGYSLMPGFELAERLFGMTWRFYFTEDEDRLIICDHPGDFALPKDVTEESFRAFFTKDAEFHVPLTPNLLFTAYYDDFNRAFGGLLSREDVVRINRRMAQRAEQFIISTKCTFPGDEVLEE